jgi:hypothetical protein
VQVHPRFADSRLEPRGIPPHIYSPLLESKDLASAVNFPGTRADHLIGKFNRRGLNLSHSALFPVCCLSARDSLKMHQRLETSELGPLTPLSHGHSSLPLHPCALCGTSYQTSGIRLHEALTTSADLPKFRFWTTIQFSLNTCQKAMTSCSWLNAKVPIYVIARSRTANRERSFPVLCAQSVHLEGLTRFFWESNTMLNPTYQKFLSPTLAVSHRGRVSSVTI